MLILSLVIGIAVAVCLGWDRSCSHSECVTLRRQVAETHRRVAEREEREAKAREDDLIARSRVLYSRSMHDSYHGRECPYCQKDADVTEGPEA